MVNRRELAYGVFKEAISKVDEITQAIAFVREVAEGDSQHAARAREALDALKAELRRYGPPSQ